MTVYVSTEAPPVEVGAEMAIAAVVELPDGTDAVAAEGAEGATGETPRVITTDPVVVSPLESVVTAVIVNCVGSIATSGVPEIVPVVESMLNPAGSGPVIE